MESTSTPNEPRPAENGAPFSGDYWNGINPLYSSGSEQQPFGIGWEHPVFRGQTPQEDQGLYSQPPQNWQQQAPLQPAMPAEPQNFGIPQYGVQHHFTQGQTHFDSQPSNTPPPYQPYQFEPQAYYANPGIPTENFNQRGAPVLQRQVDRQPTITPNALQSPMPSYNSPAPVHGNIQGGPVNIPNNYQNQPANSSFQHTIDPQFLSAPQRQIVPQETAQNEFFMVNPTDFERNFQMRNGEHLQPQPQPTPVQGLVPDTSNKMSTQQLLGNGVSGVMKMEKPAPKRVKKEKPIKQAEIRMKKDPKPTVKHERASQESSSSSETEDSDSELEVEMDEPSPIPPARPQDPEGGIKYDTQKAVWWPRNKQPPGSAVKNAMILFSDTIKSVRDTWKTRSEALKVAENQNQEDKIPSIKKDVIFQRRLLDLIINTTLEYGHPAFVARFGEHPITVSAFYSFLLDRHTASDSDGQLTRNILKLMTRFITMDQAMLEKTKNDKILNRFVKKAGEITKKLAQVVLDNAATATKRKNESAKEKAAPKTTSNKHTPGTIGTNPQVVINVRSIDSMGTKRPRDGESNGMPPTKRVVSTSQGKPAPKTLAKRPADGNQETKPGQTNVNPANARPKANMVTPKPTPSLFTSLTSASKKPGTSNAARAAAQKEKERYKYIEFKLRVYDTDVSSSTTEKKDGPAPAPAPKPPAFSFAETMADLSKPKEEVSAKPVDDGPPETDEEREKRLRKEERRKLRVSWKPDEELTEVRLFTHDPEEELGHDDSMMRDVGDVGGEGRMLKLHKDLDDEDDEDGAGREEALHPYATPQEIDFSEMESEERNRNFCKRGGIQEPKSPEKLAQDQRETNTLAVFYTSPADVPSSPKEPPASAMETTASAETSFGEPADQTQRRQAQYFAARNPQKPAPPVPNPGQVDITSLLKMIQQPAQQQQQQPAVQQQQPPQPPVSDLEKTFDFFRNQSQPQMAQNPPVSQAPPAAQVPAAPGLDLQKILAVMNAHNQMQQPSNLQQGQQQQQGQGQGNQQPNLAALLSQMTNANATPVGNQQFGFGQQQQQPQQSQHQPQQNRYEEPERKRNFDGPSYDGYNYNKRPRMNGEGHNPNHCYKKKHPKAGLVPCRYWKEGKCLKGDDCTFRHDPLS
ncbi:hypothetical protein FQN54_002660 [Arachnomyces sp. PD_36]|nr:hypothetical protein FQN54_002660 [Arachnomyces sp. PD_36]